MTIAKVSGHIMEAKKVGRGVSGVIPVIPTPFHPNEEIDEAALRRLIEFAVEIGVGAVCLPAYGSEFYKLTEQERVRAVQVAVDQAAGRLLVIAQSNHISSRVMLSIAKANIDAGAELIAIAIPRQFALPDDDLLRYLVPVLNGINVACLVQDFNPGGATVGAEFVIRLRSQCPNFRFLKLEDPLMAPKVRAIREATSEQIGILEGWGGLYMMELIPAGICGVMPGLGLADLLSRVFHLRKENHSAEAYELFIRVLPQIVFSMQNLELYHYCEKRLLENRGLLADARCRNASYIPDPLTARYVDELNAWVLLALEQAGLRPQLRSPLA
jgi:2-keto-3-deoxy-L-arabinonate dehydratase